MTPQGFTAWRDRLGLSKVKAASLLDVSRESIRLWENGQNPIPRTVELACCWLVAVDQGLVCVPEPP